MQVEDGSDLGGMVQRFAIDVQHELGEGTVGERPLVRPARPGEIVGTHRRDARQPCVVVSVEQLESARGVGHAVAP